MEKQYKIQPVGVPAGAAFSPSKKYRYALWRIWDYQKPMVAFIGLNPSTANELKNDPTIRRVMGFAQGWGFGGVLMLNLFGLVSSNPKALLAEPDPLCENDIWVMQNANACAEIVFAWGAFKVARERGKYFASLFPEAKCLGHNQDGSPFHPLFIPGDTQLTPFCKKK